MEELRANLADATKRAEVTRAAASAAAAEAHASILGRKRGSVECPHGEDSSVDTDKDGHPDCVDGCPLDFRKTRPGACGCGVADRDSDADGHADCVDACPVDPKKVVPGLCGCGHADLGCGCNVEPLVKGSCATTLATADPSAGAHFDLFGPDGGVVAHVEFLPGSVDVHPGAGHLQFSLADGALTMEMAGHAVGEDAHLLKKAARVCLQSEFGAQMVESLCVGFADPLAGGDPKCFESRVEWDAELKMVCGRVPVLTTVSLMRTSRHTSLEPYVVSVEPATLPANGKAVVKINGGNFHRGNLQSISIGGQAVAVNTCKVSARQIACAAAPAGRGEHLELALQFTNHKASDMLFDVRVEDAFSYQHGAVFAVEYVGTRLQVRGDNFGPVGALHQDAVQVDGQACADARVDVHDTVISCVPPVSRKRDNHAPRVSVRMHKKAKPVHSTATHFVRECDPVHEFRCQDGECVDKEAFCPMCMSGWSMCPLSMPSLVAGTCLSHREHMEAMPETFDATLDGSVGFELPIGDHGLLAAHMGAGPTHGRHCLSVDVPAAQEGFMSKVYNVSVAHDWMGTVRLDAHSDAVAEAGDVYGFCLARWDCDALAWHCVDEMLCMTDGGRVSGDVQLKAGENLLAIIHDNCPHIDNADQRDSDGDGVGDACSIDLGLVESCRSREHGNIKYIQKILKNTHYSVEEQPCPYPTTHPAVCDIHGSIFESHVSVWAGPTRPLPLKAPYPASEKGGRKPFPIRDGIHESRPKPSRP